MRVIRADRLEEFARKHADVRKALLTWLANADLAQWKSIQDVRRPYPHADAVRVASGVTVTVFNIRGNNYRLATAIDYKVGVVNILKVMTHAEYSRDIWKNSL